RRAGRSSALSDPDAPARGRGRSLGGTKRVSLSRRRIASSGERWRGSGPDPPAGRREDQPFDIELSFRSGLGRWLRARAQEQGAGFAVACADVAPGGGGAPELGAATIVSGDSVCLAFTEAMAPPSGVDPSAFRLSRASIEPKGTTYYVACYCPSAGTCTTCMGH